MKLLFNCSGSRPSIVIARYLLGALFLILTHAAQALPQGFVRNAVLTNLNSPVNVVSMPDGRLLIAEKAGVIKLYDPASTNGSTMTVLTLQGVESARERGLASIALAPDFSSSGFLYVYYTRTNAGIRNRISRFRFLNGSININTEVLVWEDNEPYQSCCHFGGGLDFGPDGMLYLTTGEEFDGPQAQNLTRAGGKIIRLNTANVTPATPWVRNASNNHIIPNDNPASITDGPGGNLDEIWAYGLRNPFRAHWDIQGNRFFIGDVGGNVQSAAYEEINLGAAGADFGWPNCEGPCSIGGVTNPVYSYDHQLATPAGGAVAAGVVYRGSQFPLQYQNRFFFSDYALGFVRYLHLNSNNQLTSVSTFDANVQTPVAIELGNDGSLYVVDYLGGRLWQYRYDSGNQAPVINYALASTLSGAAPLNVSFSASATDPDGDQLTYRWSVGDGTPDKLGQNISTNYTSDGVYFARLRVSDGTTEVLSDIIEIQVGSQPDANILYPIDGTTFVAGDTIAYEGDILNSDNNQGFDFNWTIDFLHNAHRHPGEQNDSAQGEFTISTTGHDYLGQTGYEISLTVTSPNGLSDTEVVNVFPSKIDLNLSTTPSGIPLFVDGVQTATPVAYDNIIGFHHVLSAPDSVCVSGTQYEFDAWSNGQPRVHSIVLPSNDLALNAQFSVAGTCEQLPTQGLVAWYEADFGLQTDGASRVTSWADRSGRGNDWTTVRGAPVEVGGALNGRSAVSFDGVQDALVRTGALAGIPIGRADRTVLMLASYSSVGSGGFGYGRSAANQVFGLSVSSNGNYRINGFGAFNDFISNIAAANDVWRIHDAVLNSDQITQTIDGNIATVDSHIYDTANNRMVLGADLDESPHVDMQVAALLVYNRALNSADLQGVRSYLQDKYLPDGPSDNQSPEARNDFFTAARGATTTFNVLANDSDPEGELSPQSVSILQAPSHGSVQTNLNGSINYSHDDSLAGFDSFTYRVSDTSGLVSNTATVSITIDSDDPVDPVEPILVTSGLVAHFNTESGIVRNNAGVLNRWIDQSGTSNDLATVLGNPQLVNNSLNGYPVVDFDGVDDLIRRNTSLSGFSSGQADRSMYIVANYRGAGYGGVTYGRASANETFGLGVSPQGNLMVQAWGPTYDEISNANGAGDGWVIQSVVLEQNSMRHSLNGVLIDQTDHQFDTALSTFVVGGEIDGVPFVDMQLATILIYDRALNPQENLQTIEFLNYKYFGDGAYDPGGTINSPPVATDDVITVPIGSESIISVLDNDFDLDGVLNVASLNIERETEFGDVLESSDGTVIYQNQSTQQQVDSFSYTISDDQGVESNTAEVTITIEDQDTPIDPPVVGTLPTQGLVLHLEADSGVDVQGQTVITWNDQSPSLNHLSAEGTEPSLASFTNGQSYISFDGEDDVLTRVQNITDLPAGSDERTMYTVIDYQSKGYGGVSYGVPDYNQTYGHIVHPSGRLMVQAWGADIDIQLPVNALSLGWAVQGSVVSAGEIVHYLNGEIIGTDSHQYDTVPENISIGMELDGVPFVEMNVSAVMIYDRSLSAAEHLEINQYLTDKYLQ